jgi:hypothetical protein
MHRHRIEQFGARHRCRSLGARCGCDHGTAIPTLVVRSETAARNMRDLYSQQAQESGIGVDEADLVAASMPYRLAPIFQIPIWRRVQQEDAPFYGRLRAAGFMLTFGEDGSGLSAMYLRRGSGYYIDVGASELLMDGRIKLKAASEVAHLTETSVALVNGEELPADLVVYATGYGPMNEWAARLISREVADKIGLCWGVGSGTAKDPGPWEGELRNMWKPTAQEALWFHGGNLAQSRQLIALSDLANQGAVRRRADTSLSPELSSISPPTFATRRACDHPRVTTAPSLFTPLDAGETAEAGLTVNRRRRGVLMTVATCSPRTIPGSYTPMSRTARRSSRLGT